LTEHHPDNGLIVVRSIGFWHITKSSTVRRREKASLQLSAIGRLN
jgi:hypothetical protein